jgi:hypothetical protein
MDVSPHGLIAITFNHPLVALAGLNTNSPDPPGWRVSISPRTAGHGGWLGTSTWVFYPDTGLVPSSRYSITLRGTVRDAWGESLGPDRHWSFRTAGPAVVDASPTDGARYVDPNASVKITFNQPMDHASTAAAFSLDGGGKVSGAVNWQGDTTLIFKPGVPLDSVSPYSVTVTPSASAASGRTTLGRAFHLAFRVAKPPRLVSTVPAQNATSNPYGVEFHFSAPMRQRTLDRRLTIAPPLSDLSTGSFGTTYTVSGSFQPSTTYAVNIDR